MEAAINMVESKPLGTPVFAIIAAGDGSSVAQAQVLKYNTLLFILFFSADHT